MIGFVIFGVIGIGEGCTMIGDPVVVVVEVVETVVVTGVVGDVIFTGMSWQVTKTAKSSPKRILNGVICQVINYFFSYNRVAVFCWAFCTENEKIKTLKD